MWNYRLMKHRDENEDYYAIHSVYYDEEGKPNGWSEKPEELFAESTEEIKHMLELMLSSLDKPVLDYETNEQN